MELYLEHGYLCMTSNTYVHFVFLCASDVWLPGRGVAFVRHRTWRVVLYDARDGHGQYAGYFHSVGRLMILMSHFYAFFTIVLGRVEALRQFQKVERCSFKKETGCT